MTVRLAIRGSRILTFYPLNPFKTLPSLASLDRAFFSTARLLHFVGPLAIGHSSREFSCVFYLASAVLKIRRKKKEVEAIPVKEREGRLLCLQGS